MPFYVDEKSINSNFTPPVAQALLKINTVINDRRVVPSMALRLIKDYLQPLFPEIVGAAITQKPAPYTWDDIHWLYADIAGKSKDNELLGEIALAINLIYKYTTLPHRKIEFPDPVDVTYFLHVCSHLQLPALELRRTIALDPLRLCKYCWRKASPGRHLCATCSPSNKHSEQEEQSRTICNVVDRRFNANKEGTRLKQDFDTCLNRLLTDEIMEFHKSNFITRIIPPSEGIRNWLAQRRPNLWASLALEHEGITDYTVVEKLTALLDSADQLSQGVQKQHLEVTAQMKENPYMMGPMLLRAEAWLIAKERITARWGGQRKNSGRKKQQ